jgi:cell division protein FtsI/penicillin-binding protein 2
MNRAYLLRSTLLAVVFGVLGLLVIFQIVRIQNSPQAALFRLIGEREEVEYKTVYPPRGEIYDRHGNLLAGNQTVYEVGVELSRVRNPHTIALTLSVSLGLDYLKIYTAITQPDEKQVYLQLASYVPVEKYEELEALQEEFQQQPRGRGGEQVPSLAGLTFRPHLQRSYPEGELASNLLGFVSREGRGYFGVEGKYDEQLAGLPISIWVPRDPNRVAEVPSLPSSTTLILTIHRELQAAVEQILDQALVTYGAENGTILVTDPRTGEVLALASTPRLDPNRFWEYNRVFDNASEFNRAISLPYEPGSVFKIFPMAAALDSGLVQPDTPFLDTGIIYVGGAPIRNWNQGAWGLQDMQGCIQHSLNVCLAHLAVELEAKPFYGYMQAFGIGYLTGVDLAGEAAGRLKVPGDGDWYPVELGTNSFGQGVSVTPIQMVTAASAIANNGRMVAPHVLLGMVKNGRQYNTPVQYIGSPISVATAQTLTEMLARSLENEASLALVPGYRLAGKTGTAEIPLPSGRYSYGVTNASFLGWGPIDDPQFMVYVWIEKPTASIWGSEVAAPVFRQVVEKLVVLLNIPPDAVRFQLAGP